MNRAKIIIRNNRGESISEVLVASTVISLATILLVSMISASFRMIRNSDEKMGQYYEKRNELEEMTETNSSSQLTITMKETLENLPGIYSKDKSTSISVNIFDTGEVESESNKYRFVRFE